MILDRSAIRNILVIKLRAIGDVLLSTVVLPFLRHEFPDARIDFLCEIPAAGVVQGNPHINNVLVFDSKSENGLSLIFRIRRGSYDLVIDLFGNPRSAIVTLLSGARHRVGYRFSWRQYCYSVVVNPRGGEVHNAEFNLDALRALNIPVGSQEPYFPLGAEARLFADEFIRVNNLEHSFLLAINAGGGWYTKRWRADSYASLLRRCCEEFDLRAVLIWGPGEVDAVRAIAGKVGQGAVITPPTTIPQLGAILQRCTMMVTNDSGPMHIASAVGVPVVAIFGPTNPRFQGPLSPRSEVVRKEELDCLGCNLTACPIGNPCMEALSVDQVYQTVKRFISELHTSSIERHG